jgi:hypothetical protein
MLIELKAYDNLGTPKYFYELLCIIKNSKLAWQKADLDKLFYNKIIDGRRIFDGCFPLVYSLKILISNTSGKISISQEFIRFLNSENQMREKFIEILLFALKDDDDFKNIFSSKNLSYDIIYRKVQINNSAFALKFANFKQLLIDFEVLNVHPNMDAKKYVFNLKYKKLFDSTILPELRKRNIGIEELRRDLEQNHKHGVEAELYVLEFEKNRLNNKPGIEWVAEYSVAEGFDILSFNSISSIKNDRFIEVKSYFRNSYH